MSTVYPGHALSNLERDTINIDIPAKARKVLIVDETGIAVGSSGLIVKLDEASATITYVGKATPGTITSAATWQIFRMDTATLALDLLFADGDNDFNNVWDDRVGLSYS